MLGAGCGGDGEPATTPEETGTDGSSTVATDEVEIVDFEFDPPAITIDAGTEVSWTNRDEAAHTASAEDGSFDTGTLNRGDEGSASLQESGSYAYVCEFHPFMKGTVVVK